MKCPKCGYTSFDYLNECKKCGTDISDVRAMLGVIAISPEERAQSKPAALVASPEPVHDELDFSTAGLLSDVGPEHEETHEVISSDFITDFEAEGTAEEPETESLVEHTSYSRPSAQAAPAAQDEEIDIGFTGAETEEKEEETEDDFLDMDFSDVFGDDKKK
jgi:hypothetical protein